MEHAVSNIATLPDRHRASPKIWFEKNMRATPPQTPPPDTPPIYRIVLTGGPCGGKTTSLSHITERLESVGFRTFQVPEAATILFTGGVNLSNVNIEQEVRFEANLVSLQMALEDTFYDLALSTGKPCVLLCDRGTMDASAYIAPEMWQALLDEQGWTEVGLRDRRYDAVIHLVTAADGAEPFYTHENNPARKEPAEQARVLDKQLRDAWVGHPHLRIIDNSTGFAEKIHRAIMAVSKITDTPVPKKIERKFLLKRTPRSSEFPIHFKTFTIEQTYLLSQDNNQIRLRRRGANGAFTYTRTIRQPMRDGEHVELKRQIAGREYLGLLDQADPTKAVIRKSRRCFLWNNQYYELDTFIEPQEGLCILNVEYKQFSETLLPDFLEIEREVTGDENYMSYTIATKAGQSEER
ncbi:MAG: AAA family ATPase [Deltaproteobacteria bacterium]|nr:AAA family ATPase [Deltaproteobacteria bacterium]